MCPDEFDEDSFVRKSHMRHQAIFVAAYVKDHTVIAYEIDGRSKHCFHITRSMPLRPLRAASLWLRLDADADPINVRMRRGQRKKFIQ